MPLLGHLRSISSRPELKPVIWCGATQLALLGLAAAVLALAAVGRRDGGFSPGVAWTMLAVSLAVILTAGGVLLIAGCRGGPRGSASSPVHHEESRRRLAADISHELKTPLSVLLGRVQMFARGPRTGAEQEHFLAGLQDEVRRLAGIVNGLLILSEGRGELQPAALCEEPLNEVVADAVGRSTVLARQCDVRLVPQLHWPGTAEPELMVSGEPELMRIMVENLIRSAVRFSGSGETLRIQVRRAESGAHITIHNQACDLPVEKLGLALGSGRSGDCPSPEAGLGLLLAEGVARLHGARIRADAAAEGGVQINVWVPLASAPGGARTPAAPGWPRLAPAR